MAPPDRRANYVYIPTYSASPQPPASSVPPSASPSRPYALADRVGRFPRLYGATGAAAFACEVIRSQVTAVCAVYPQIADLRAHRDTDAWALLSPASS
ncbi:hypothetical protein NFJ02_19g32520 [Pycnococcus provasolii]